MLNSQTTSGAARVSKIATIAWHLGRLSLLGCLATVAWTPSALADGSSTPYGGGGPMAKFDAIIGQYNASGELFRIEGHCQSSCTMFLAIRNVCVDPNASLLFHAALSARERDHAPYPEKEPAYGEPLQFESSRVCPRQSLYGFVHLPSDLRSRHHSQIRLSA